jgi:RES domain-containing protein
LGEDSLTFATVERGGEYLRVADPEWGNPLDPSFARASGGRWNPPGSFPVLYLSADVATAQANVDRKFADLPYGPTDLLPTRRPILVGAVVPLGNYVDVVTDDGCVRSALPASYPLDERGRAVPHERCQAVGVEARRQGLPGIACRSAARPHGEELALFTGDAGSPTRVEAFDQWDWGGHDRQ